MPQLDRNVTGLNQDVMNAVKAIQNPAKASLEEAKAVRTAILKDGTIDDVEADLMAELAQKDNRQVTVSSGSATVSLTMFDDDAKGQLAISMLALGRRKAELLVDKGMVRLEKSVFRFKEAYREAEQEIDEIGDKFGQRFDQLMADGREFMTELFTYQYGEGTEEERQANCGPSSASMILKQFGLEPPPLAALRKMVNAPTGEGNGAFAMSTDQVGKSVQSVARQYGKEISYRVTPLTTNVDLSLKAIKDKLAAGEKVILLSSNLAVQSGNRGKGHYVVVREVLPNGSMIVDDPQARLEKGLGRTHTREQFANGLRRRANLFHRPNEILSFREGK